VVSKETTRARPKSPRRDDDYIYLLRPTLGTRRTTGGAFSGPCARLVLTPRVDSRITVFMEQILGFFS